MFNVNPFITDIFPEQLATDQIANQRHQALILLELLGSAGLSWVVEDDGKAYNSILGDNHTHVVN